MEKINFQNDVTKLNKETFDTFQDNIENAITAIKVEILKEENPVGHIRFETTNVNPATYLGFGTWVLWGSGRVPIGVDTEQTEFDTVEKTGGSNTADISHTHTIASHNHSGKTGSHALTIKEMPKHTHETDGTFWALNGSGSSEFGSGTAGSNPVALKEAGGGEGHTHTISDSGEQTTDSAGYTSLSLLQSYITCYMWKRTA